MMKVNFGLMLALLLAATVCVQSAQTEVEVETEVETEDDTEMQVRWNALPAGITDLGCWKDDLARTLKGPPQRYSYSPKTCAEEARKRGQTIFALQNGNSETGWCVTSTGSDNYQRLGKASNQACTPGGAWSVNRVYQIAASTVPTPAPTLPASALPAGMTDLGCWNDDLTRALQGGPKLFGYTPATCAEEARKRGQTIFALQNNGWCVTSTALTTTSASVSTTRPARSADHGRSTTSTKFLPPSCPSASTIWAVGTTTSLAP